MFDDWWRAHAFEIYLHAAWSGLVLLVLATIGAVAWARRRAKSLPHPVSQACPRCREVFKDQVAAAEALRERNGT